jgi:hypothetical protein
MFRIAFGHTIMNHTLLGAIWDQEDPQSRNPSFRPPLPQVMMMMMMMMVMMNHVCPPIAMAKALGFVE